MAKIIKYQLASEHLKTVIVEVPLLDENGEPVMKAVSVQKTEEIYIGDTAIQIPVFDEQGNPVMESVLQPVTTKEHRQDPEVIFTDVTIRCETDEALQANLSTTEQEAYNGEYTVEDDGQSNSEIVVQETTDDVLNALLGVTE